MSLRGEFYRVLDKYKSGKWDRDKSAAALEKYFNAHQTAEIIAELERLQKGTLDSNHFTPEVGKAAGGDFITIYRGKCFECELQDRINELKLKAKETQL